MTFLIFNFRTEAAAYKILENKKHTKYYGFTVNQSRNVRYLGIVTCHIESDTCLVATPTQAFEWSAKAHACSAKEMTVASVLLIAQACFEWSITKTDRVVFKVLEVMAKCSRSVRTRNRTVAKLVPDLCERPFPDDWKSPDTRRKADAVGA